MYKAPASIPDISSKGSRVEEDVQDHRPMRPWRLRADPIGQRRSSSLIMFASFCKWQLDTGQSQTDMPVVHGKRQLQRNVPSSSFVTVLFMLVLPVVHGKCKDGFSAMFQAAVLSVLFMFPWTFHGTHRVLLFGKTMYHLKRSHTLASRCALNYQATYLFGMFFVNTRATSPSTFRTTLAFQVN